MLTSLQEELSEAQSLLDEKDQELQKKEALLVQMRDRLEGIKTKGVRESMGMDEACPTSSMAYFEDDDIDRFNPHQPLEKIGMS